MHKRKKHGCWGTHCTHTNEAPVYQNKLTGHLVGASPRDSVKDVFNNWFFGYFLVFFEKKELRIATLFANTIRIDGGLDIYSLNIIRTNCDIIFAWVTKLFLRHNPIDFWKIRVDFSRFGWISIFERIDITTIVWNVHILVKNLFSDLQMGFSGFALR